MKKTGYTFFFLFFVFTIYSQQIWIVPKDIVTKQNPVASNENSFEIGKSIYHKLCASCHGITGKGDVPAMQGLQPKPSNFTLDSFQKQTDGAIYYKLSEGRGLMASYKSMLSEEERWSLVNYLRSFKKSVIPEQSSETTPIKLDEKPTETNEKSVSKEQKKTNKEVVTNKNAFPFTTLINTKTTRIAPGFGLVLQHRFGATKFDESFVQNFMGLDLAANMRFAFEIPVNDKFYFEIGRTRYGKFYDIGAKYVILQQSNKAPVSFVFYENVAITTEKAPQYSSSARFDNGDAFTYQFKHRLYYDTQFIISRKFSKRFSAQFATEFVWRNLTPHSVKPKEKAFVLAFPISLRYKIGLMSAVSMEIMPNSHPKTMPISFAYEVVSSGNHVFQITLTNTDRMLSQNIFFNPTIKYGKGEFMLGFNLIRYF